MKKILALVLAVMLVIGMTPLTSAAIQAGNGTIIPNSSINWSVAKDKVVLGLYNGTVFEPLPTDEYGTSAVGYEYDFKTKYPGETMQIYFGVYMDSSVTVTLGVSDVSVAPNTWALLTKSDLSANKLGYHSLITAGSSNFTYKGTLETGLNTAACVQYKVNDPFVSTGDTTVSFSTYVTYDGKRLDPTRVNAKAKIENKKQTVRSSDDWVYTYEIPVLDPVEAYIKSLNIVASKDDKLVVSSAVHQDRKYYALAKTNDLSAVANDYPEIFRGYDLYQVNLGNGTVKIDAGMNAWVYTMVDGELELLGRSNAALAITGQKTTYYLADAEIPGVGVEEPEEPTENVGPSEATNPPSGGNDVNVNSVPSRNPSTGR